MSSRRRAPRKHWTSLLWLVLGAWFLLSGGFVGPDPASEASEREETELSTELADAEVAPEDAGGDGGPPAAPPPLHTFPLRTRAIAPRIARAPSPWLPDPPHGTMLGWGNGPRGPPAG